MKLKFGFVKLRYRGLQKKLFGLCSTNHGIPLEFSSAFSMVHRLHTKCRLTSIFVDCFDHQFVPSHPASLCGSYDYFSGLSEHWHRALASREILANGEAMGKAYCPLSCSRDRVLRSRSLVVPLTRSG